jgi:hypothetical protein
VADNHERVLHIELPMYAVALAKETAKFIPCRVKLKPPVVAPFIAGGMLCESTGAS